MRKYLSLTILVLLLIGGCGKVLQSDKVKVTFWHGLSGPLGDTLNEMIKEFNRTHDDIEVVANPISSYAALSQKLMASIQAKKQPDIAQVFESWTAKYVEAGVLVPIDDLIAEDEIFGAEDMADIYPVFLKSNTYRGNIWSFPFNKSVRAYFYNKDDFYRAGLDPNYFPQTWSEFRKYCQLLTREGGKGERNRYGTNFNVNEWQFVNLLHQAGGTIVDANDRPVLNSPQGVEAVSFITDMMYKDKSVYLVREYEGQNDFLSGIVAMYEGSSVSITHMRQQPINFNIGYAPLPTFRTNQSAVSGANIVIFKSGNAKREKGAWEFIKWFTATEQTAKWSAKTCYMPVRRSAMESPVIQDFLTEFPQFKGIFAQLENAVFEPQNPAWFKARPELKGYLEQAITQKLTPQEALDQAADKFAQLIAAEQK
ncbi:MAG: ABC transporter substrate-binding protein [Candidatus Cloacimonadaceae bacterium]|nr:ABC transporter substrate-binding protein [Candidatus Cloacimonadaceae bacterium]